MLDNFLSAVLIVALAAPLFLLVAMTLRVLSDINKKAVRS